MDNVSVYHSKSHPVQPILPLSPSCTQTPLSSSFQTNSTLVISYDGPQFSRNFALGELYSRNSFHPISDSEKLLPTFLGNLCRSGTESLFFFPSAFNCLSPLSPVDKISFEDLQVNPLYHYTDAIIHGGCTDYEQHLFIQTTFFSLSFWFERRLRNIWKAYIAPP